MINKIDQYIETSTKSMATFSSMILILLALNLCMISEYGNHFQFLEIAMIPILLMFIISVMSLTFLNIYVKYFVKDREKI